MWKSKKIFLFLLLGFVCCWTAFASDSVVIDTDVQYYLTNEGKEGGMTPTFYVNEPIYVDISYEVRKGSSLVNTLRSVGGYVTGNSDKRRVAVILSVHSLANPLVSRLQSASRLPYGVLSGVDYDIIQDDGWQYFVFLLPISGKLNPLTELLLSPQVSGAFGISISYYLVDSYDNNRNLGTLAEFATRGLLTALGDSDCSFTINVVDR